MLSTSLLFNTSGASSSLTDHMWHIIYQSQSQCQQIYIVNALWAKDHVWCRWSGWLVQMIRLVAADSYHGR